MDLIDKVRQSEKTKHLWRDKYNSVEWKNANKLNILLFEMPLNNKPKCKCLEDLFFMLKSPNINQKYKKKMENRFKVKKGKVLGSHQFGFHLTEHSNDEQIMEALRLVPSLIAQMEKYPANWEQVVNGNEQVQEVVEEVESNDPDEKNGEFIDDWSKEQLYTYAKLRGLQVSKRMGKAKLLDLING